MPSQTEAKQVSETQGSNQDRSGKTHKYPGIRLTCNGNQLVAEHTEVRITDGGVYYPITPSTEGGEIYQQSVAEGKLNIFGRQKVAIETEGEHAAQGGATALSMTGKRVVNFTSGQGIVYAMEQYYHAPGKLSTMVVEVGARALTKHALNVHCGHDDINAALDTGWIMMMAKEAQQAADQAVILRKVTELSLNPGMNIQDGMLTTHLERTFFALESEMLREYLGDSEDMIDCPTPAQRELFGPKRLRVPEMIDLKSPVLLGTVQNQEHHMNGIVARRNNFSEPILGFLEEAFQGFQELTGRHYGFVSEYRTEDAETVFLSLGCAAENIEAAVDHLRTQQGAKVGSIHLNVIRPFPEAAIVNALRGKKNVIILERTDESLSGDNPMARDVRTALGKALEAVTHGGEVPAVKADEIPRVFRGVYGMGSRDFRPEHSIGAYQYATGEIRRQDGRGADDGETFMVLGVNHPYAVESDQKVSLLPDCAIAVRFHSIGGWGMITTGKNLGAIIGEFGSIIAKENPNYDDFGRLEEKMFVSANPKYGSEKKGAPTNYFLVVARDKIRVNCDLRHVDVVLCCDPKAFTHCNPLEGLNEGGSFVWECSDDPSTAWIRIPAQYRQEIIDKKVNLYILPGFDIAKNATDREDLQLRMQGNTFLGAFFKVSTFLEDNHIDEKTYRKVVRDQYVSKFGRFGDAVVDSNMKVMDDGFHQVRKIDYGAIEAEDHSSMRLPPVLPYTENHLMETAGCGSACSGVPMPEDQTPRPPLMQIAKFDSEYRSGLGYNQPASALASVGVMGAATGSTNSKYVARRETPVFIAENCTQCMACITACPDTALPNMAQNIKTILQTAVLNYVKNSNDKSLLLKELEGIETRSRKRMVESVSRKDKLPFKDIIREEVSSLNGGITQQSKDEFCSIIDTLPLAYSGVTAIFRSIENKNPGEGGLFSIFVSDHCKGCGECVEECGDHDALRMVRETEELNSVLTTAQIFSRLLPDTQQKYLGQYQDDDPYATREAALRNHLMVRRNYEALVSGDGACAGCGEKSVLRALASVTESYMRPLYHRKADRLRDLADRLEKDALRKLNRLKEQSESAYNLMKRTVAHTIMGLGGEDLEDTNQRLEDHGAISDEETVNAVCAVLRQDAFNHRELQAVDGRLANGMATMVMGASTGCNTVYGSTTPSNPHPYPWMNSLFQDGATISWLIGESLILNHARRSVVPERLAAIILDESISEFGEADYFKLTRLTDAEMTDQEIRELPKVWVVGGDGALGDIGYQNVSKVILQNRPNINILMLDTQVYSNTGGQNSDSSTMLGGYDMNQFGEASQGKLIEKKNVAESFTSGHGSPYVCQVSMANSAKMYRTMLEGLEYRGTSFYQCFTTCQPEHGVPDYMAAKQAQRIRDCRGMPEFVYNPRMGETSQEAFSLKGNPSLNRDWWQTKYQSNGEKYNYSVAHWALTEARFRKHLKGIKEDQLEGKMHLDEILVRVTQDDVVNRKVFDPMHRSFVPDFQVYIKVQVGDQFRYHVVSRQMVLFAVERRKAWRMLQSKAGIINKDYQAQKALLKKVDEGKISNEEFLTHTVELFRGEMEALK